MTDEGMERPDLDAIRKRIEREPLNGATVGMVREARRDRDALLAEVERLRAQPSHQQQPGWLPIESAPSGEWVLTWNGSFRDIAMKNTEGRWFTVDNFSFIREPECWMPLPAPPTDRRVTEETKP